MPQPKQLNQATGQWVHGAAVTDPSGGATADTQARAAAVSLLAALRAAGVLGGGTGLNVGHSFNAATAQITLQPAIADPTGGVTIDDVARPTIISILGVLRRVGIIAGGTAGPQFTLNGPTNQLCQGPAIADPSGGSTIDTQVRTALTSALAAMRDAALITGGTGQ
ncbi:hypothetical protein [Streptomyces sp. STR69]|uniref:hypothetical protein n=1 Tax=Streptomyces sp. STR69 TaxID=1796942 RepID=UPI0021C84E4A|nr:hypothetical protein [Streptomyces sp. STR69]